LPTHMASLVAYLVSKAVGVLGPSVALGVQRLVLRLVASAADPRHADRDYDGVGNSEKKEKEAAAVRCVL
jgi:hypothetical protein